jgi:hypothetical protein
MSVIRSSSYKIIVVEWLKILRKLRVRIIIACERGIRLLRRGCLGRRGFDLAFKQGEIVCGRDLQCARVANHDPHSATPASDRRRIIGESRQRSFVELAKGVVKRTCPTRLRGLRHRERAAIERFEHGSVGANALDGVGNSERWNDTIPPISERSKHAIDERLGNARSSGVVHENCRRSSIRNGGKPSAYTRCARRTTDLDRCNFVASNVINEHLRRPDPILGHYKHDRINSLVCFKGTQRMHEHRLARKPNKSLGSVRSEALACPSGK